MHQVFLAIFLRNSEPLPGLGGKFFCGEKFRKPSKVCRKYFLVRGYGARFLAEKNFASDEKLAKSIFWYNFYENPNPKATFFVYVKLLISLLNGAFFRLGDNFSVRGYGARFSAGPLQQLFKRMVGTPYGFCCAAGLGKNCF